MGNCVFVDPQPSPKNKKIVQSKSFSSLNVSKHYKRNSISHVNVTKYKESQVFDNLVMKQENNEKGTLQSIQTIEGEGQNLLNSQKTYELLNQDTQSLPVQQSPFKFQPEEQLLVESKLSQSRGSLINFQYWCIYCQNSINNYAIQLSCKHTYHVNCLKEQLINQINNLYCYLYCQCGNQINMKILRYYKDNENMLKQLLNNQLNQIFQQKQWKGFKIKCCRNCRFIYINSQPNLKCKCFYEK